MPATISSRGGLPCQQTKALTDLKTARSQSSAALTERAEAKAHRENLGAADKIKMSAGADAGYTAR